MRIVVVDDDKDICALLKKALTSMGHDVTTFSDPTKVPFFDNSGCPCKPEASCADALIADIVTPHVEGIDFMRKLKEAGCWTLSLGNVAIMSGYLTLHYLDELNDLGIRYFRKPFHLKDIYAWVKDCERRIADAGASVEL